MKYSGLSIGPIYKTLSNAKKTAELWAGSFVFSLLMKNIIKHLVDDGISKDDFITPYVDKDELQKDEFIGKYHDRLIYKGSKDKLLKAIDKAVDDIAEIIYKDKIFNVTKQEIFEDLKKYFRFFVVEIETDNPMKDVNEFLNSKEMFFEVYNGKNYLIKWIKNIRKSKFKKDIAGKFKSLPQIAISDIDLKNYKDMDEQDALTQIIEEKKLPPIYKYVAIVHADGDNMSKLIEGKNEKDLREISKKLFDFANFASEKIESFNAQLVYAGGDDLLFFAPIKHKEKTIFDLIKELREEFNNQLSKKDDKKENEKPPTLSFGVSITYYKFPLNEALENSRSLLFNEAKDKKDSVAYEVIKHSGQTFKNVLSAELFDEFVEFIKIIEEEKFLHSLYSKISYYEFVLKEINSKERLKAFFDNYFNESSHKKYKNFFEKLVDYMFKEKVDTKLAYSTLRFMKFLKGDK